MGVDEDIQNIYLSIYNINITLANIDQGLGNALNSMDFGLDVFDEHVTMVVNKARDVSNNIISQTSSIPGQWLYLTILLFVILILLILIAYMMFYIVIFVLNRKQKMEEYRMWYLQNVMKKKDENYYGSKTDREIMSDDTPPPTYSEYVQTASLYANYHDEIEAQRTQNFGTRSTRLEKIPDEYSTLI